MSVLPPPGDDSVDWSALEDIPVPDDIFDVTVLNNVQLMIAFQQVVDVIKERKELFGSKDDEGRRLASLYGALKTEKLKRGL